MFMRKVHDMSGSKVQSDPHLLWCSFEIISHIIRTTTCNHLRGLLINLHGNLLASSYGMHFRVLMGIYTCEHGHIRKEWRKLPSHLIYTCTSFLLHTKTITVRIIALQCKRQEWFPEIFSRIFHNYYTIECTPLLIPSLLIQYVLELQVCWRVIYSSLCPIPRYNILLSLLGPMSTYCIYN